MCADHCRVVGTVKRGSRWLDRRPVVGLGTTVRDRVGFEVLQLERVPVSSKKVKRVAGSTGIEM